jgi:hypothetical protein
MDLGPKVCVLTISQSHSAAGDPLRNTDHQTRTEAILYPRTFLSGPLRPEAGSKRSSFYPLGLFTRLVPCLTDPIEVPTANAREVPCLALQLPQCSCLAKTLRPEVSLQIPACCLKNYSYTRSSRDSSPMQSW